MRSINYSDRIGLRGFVPISTKSIDCFLSASIVLCMFAHFVLLLISALLVRLLYRASIFEEAEDTGDALEPIPVPSFADLTPVRSLSPRGAPDRYPDLGEVVLGQQPNPTYWNIDDRRALVWLKRICLRESVVKQIQFLVGQHIKSSSLVRILNLTRKKGIHRVDSLEWSFIS